MSNILNIIPIFIFRLDHFFFFRHIFCLYTHVVCIHTESVFICLLKVFNWIDRIKCGPFTHWYRFNYPFGKALETEIILYSIQLTLSTSVIYINKNTPRHTYPKTVLTKQISNLKKCINEASIFFSRDLYEGKWDQELKNRAEKIAAQWNGNIYHRLAQIEMLPFYGWCFFSLFIIPCAFFTSLFMFGCHWINTENVACR